MPINKYDIIADFLHVELEDIKDKMHIYIDKGFDTSKLNNIKKYIEGMIGKNENNRIENDFKPSTQEDTEDIESTEDVEDTEE